jgi:tRNA-specific adenosine deaminase 1
MAQANITPIPTALKGSLPSQLASLVVEIYLALPSSHHPLPRSNGTREWTPLAGIALSSLCQQQLLLISIGAGSKVLPTSKKSTSGDVLNDLHAEVLAARGARRWLLEEVARCSSSEGAEDPYQSLWIQKSSLSDGPGKWTLKQGVTMEMYVSTLLCELDLSSLLPSPRLQSRLQPLTPASLSLVGGDASTLHLSKLQESQDPAMAALKSTSSPTVFIEGSLARGRDGYLNIGACRTKPGQSGLSALP